MKTKNIILILICMFLMSACENDWLSKGNLYTKNETGSEFVVYVRYNDTIANFRNNLKSVNFPYQKTQLILSRSVITSNKDREGPIYRLPHSYIYVLNRKDSTYIKIESNSCYEFGSTAYYYGYDDVDSKNKIFIAKYYLTINDSLVSKMVKDKLVADSILNIWY